MLKPHGSAESRFVINQVLSLCVPHQPVVAQDKPDPGQVAFPDQGTDFLHPGLQARVDGHHTIRVEEELDRLNGLGHPGLFKVRSAFELLFVFALEKGRGELAIREIRQMDGVDAEVVSSLREAFKGVVLAEVEQVFDAQHHKSGGTMAHRIGSEVQLLRKARLERVRQGAHLLVNDAELDVHGRVLLADGCGGKCGAESVGG